MARYEIGKVISPYKDHFECEMCGKSKFSNKYEYKSRSLIPGYETRHFKKLCADCIYKECFGSKTWRKEKKNRSLE